MEMSGLLGCCWHGLGVTVGLVGDQHTRMGGFGVTEALKGDQRRSPRTHTSSVHMCNTLAGAGPARVPQWSNF